MRSLKDFSCNEPSDDNPLRGLIGLQNLGNTCYMNSALQALSNCQQLTRFMLTSPAFIKGKRLSQSYSDLMNELWNPDTRTYAVPTSIIRNIKFIYPAFRGCTQQDAQEFLRCFLEQLHDELKNPIEELDEVDQSKEAPENCETKTKTKEEDNDNDIDVDVDHTNDQERCKDDAQRSIISDTFEFKISSSVVCSNCKNISTTKETFKDLSIPIPARDHPYYQVTQSDLDSGDDETEESAPLNGADECHQMETSYLNSISLTKWFWDLLSQLGYWFWGPQVSLQDCLSIFFGTDPLEGDNEYSCEVCTKKNKGVKYLKIMESPEVLCIHFKRYESISSSKITTHVSFPLTGLDLAPFMSENVEPQNTTYNLIACICHHGSALLTGHYTTYALNCYDDQWYEFDDMYVTSVEDYQVENSEAYILFYQKSA